jgi:hypothetical protein
MIRTTDFSDKVERWTQGIQHELNFFVKMVNKIYSFSDPIRDKKLKQHYRYDLWDGMEIIQDPFYLDNYVVDLTPDIFLDAHQIVKRLERDGINSRTENKQLIIPLSDA